MNSTICTHSLAKAEGSKYHRRRAAGASYRYPDFMSKRCHQDRFENAKVSYVDHDRKYKRLVECEAECL